MDDIHRRIATRIKALARERRLSANKLVDFSGIARGAMSNILTGKKSPTIRTLAKIAKALDVEIKELVS
jgi:transcriptional regulator with XRE-family HTH domain